MRKRKPYPEELKPKHLRKASPDTEESPTEGNISPSGVIRSGSGKSRSQAHKDGMSDLKKLLRMD